MISRRDILKFGITFPLVNKNIIHRDPGEYSIHVWMPYELNKNVSWTYLYDFDIQPWPIYRFQNKYILGQTVKITKTALLWGNRLSYIGKVEYVDIGFSIILKPYLFRVINSSENFPMWTMTQ